MAKLEELTRAMGKPHVMLTGRATTALWLLLEGLGMRGRDVLIPVNVCYSIVHGITMSGNRPVFTDVDEQDGNVRLEHVLPRVGGSTAALLLPHQYGNPCADTARLAELCGARGLLLIEDCAAGFEGSVEGQRIGTFGDYVLFSFGARKTVDASLGGALASSMSLADLEQRQRDLDVHSGRTASLTELYSALFRTIYHSGHYDELAGRLAAFQGPFDEIYRYRLRPADEQRVHDALSRYEKIREVHRAAQSAYDRELPFGGDLRPYRFAADALPWRYNVRVSDSRLRERIIARLLEAGVRVSVWYPPIHRLFGDDGDYPNAAGFARSILNLPLDVTTPQASQICSIIRSATEARVSG